MNSEEVGREKSSRQNLPPPTAARNRRKQFRRTLPPGGRCREATDEECGKKSDLRYKSVPPPHLKPSLGGRWQPEGLTDEGVTSKGSHPAKPVKPGSMESFAFWISQAKSSPSSTTASRRSPFPRGKVLGAVEAFRYSKSLGYLPHSSSGTSCHLPPGGRVRRNCFRSFRAMEFLIPNF